MQTYRFASSLVVLVACLLLLSSGCNRPTAPQTERAPIDSGEHRAEARRLVQQMAMAYRNAAAYSDQAYVRLAYAVEGQPFEDRAPLSVCYQHPRRLKLHAYAMRMSSDGKRMRATIIDPETNHFDGQCLSVTAPTELSLEAIYSDPVVAQFAGAGMGGPAPQLELLLSDDPLADWLQSEAKIQLGQRDRIDGHMCQAVTIEVDELKYVLWIDSSAMLLRRIELPWNAIATDLAQDERLSSASLTIEFQQARFCEELPAWRFAASVPPMAQEVTAFVTPPPAPPHRLVGTRLPSFTLRDASDRLTVTQRGSGRDATVMMWIANHPTSHQATDALQKLIESLPTDVQKRLYATVVMAEPRGGNSTGAMLQNWNVGMRWIDDTEAVGRDVFQITEAPCLVVLEHDGRVAMYHRRLSEGVMQALPGSLAEIVNHYPLGEIMRQNDIVNQANYLRAIAAVGGMQFPLADQSLVLASEFEKTRLR